MAPGTYSASVVRGKRTYVFFNGTDDNDNRVLKLMKVTDKEAPTQTFRVNGNDIPASDGPIAAINIEGDRVRLYVVNKKTIIEYGLDTTPEEDDDWKVEAFTKSIKLGQGSFLNALSGLSGGAYVIRLFYQQEDSNRQVTQNTYTNEKGWVEKTISS